MSKHKSLDRQNEMQGEGNYTAAKEYDEATQNFVKSGKVEKAARDAKPKNTNEEREMLEAEEKGRARGKPERRESRIPNSGSGNTPRNSVHGR